MRKIVGGKMYDTDKATVVYDWRGMDRVLYVTAKGNYFMYYAGTGKIEPWSEDQVKNFLAEHDADKYVELFGEVEEA